MPQKRPQRLTTEDVEAIFGAFAAASPEPKTELDHINPCTLLVAVVLSAQATDAGVNKATPALFRLADTPEKMVGAAERIEELIKTILPQQGKERLRTVAPAGRGLRRRVPRTRGRSDRCRASGGRPPMSHTRRLPAADRGRHASLPESPTAPGLRRAPIRSKVELALLKVVPDRYLLLRITG